MKNAPAVPKLRRKALYAAVVGSLVATGGAFALGGCGGNPCASRKGGCSAQQRGCGACAPAANPSARANPSASKRGCNPCAAACDPCAPACDPCAPCGPMGACGPCGPCGPCAGADPDDYMRPAGFEGPAAPTEALITKGEALWNDTSLSGGNNMSCNTCHAGNAQLAPSFAEPYPHYVSMPDREVHADEMVQFCMVVPMNAEPLAWDSEALAALTAFTIELQQDFDPCAACAPAGCGPCGPCGACAPAACGPCGACAPAGCGPCGTVGANTRSAAPKANPVAVARPTVH